MNRLTCIGKIVDGEVKQYVVVKNVRLGERLSKTK